MTFCVYFRRGGDGALAQREAQRVKHPGAHRSYRLILITNVPQHLSCQAFSKHFIHIESSQLLISSDICATIVLIVSLKKWRHRKGEVLARDHLLPQM